MLINTFGASDSTSEICSAESASGGSSEGSDANSQNVSTLLLIHLSSFLVGWIITY